MQRSSLLRRRTVVSRGFSLLELVVVIGVLVALVGILVPKLPDLLNRANNASWSTNLVELDKAIMEYAALNNGQYPDGWDSLVTSSGSLYIGLPGGSSATLSSTVLTTGTLSQGQVDRINRAGITSIQLMKNTVSTNFGATYFAYSDTPGTYTNPVSLASGTTVALLRANGSGSYLFNGQKMYLDSTHTYWIVGVGQACSLIGPNGIVKDCPVLRHSDGCLNPETAYCRAAALFDLGTTAVPIGDRGVAKFVGTVGLGDKWLKFSEEMIAVPNRMN